MPSTTPSATTSTAAERVLLRALAIAALIALTGCGGSAEPVDNGAFEPAIRASQPTIRKQAV